MTFKGVEEIKHKKTGIRYHSFLIAYILKCFNPEKIHEIKDVQGKLYYLNKGSLADWLMRNNRELIHQPLSKQDVLFQLKDNFLLNKALEDNIVEHFKSIPIIGRLKNNLQEKNLTVEMKDYYTASLKEAETHYADAKTTNKIE